MWPVAVDPHPLACENCAKGNDQFAQIMAGDFLIDFCGRNHHFIVGRDVLDHLVVHVEPERILDLIDVLAETIETGTDLKWDSLRGDSEAYLIGMTICSFHVGLEPSTVDVRSVFCLNVAVTNGRTFACR